ncbi:MAG: lysophospholipid acyltransferase family protein [Selenomonadaceae bacterium]|nr:lysophospholipid acyltransferase family protein [Selenomonadaceae bacterium]
MSYYIVLLISKIACLLPWSLCRKIGWLMTQIAWPFVPKRRKNMARENIMRCLNVDAEEAERISKASAVQWGDLLFEVLRFPVLKNTMKDHVKVEGLHYLTDYINSPERQSKGGVIVTCHSDNWELMGGAFAQYGISLVGVAKQQKSSNMDKFINEYRTLIGMHITYKTGVREMFDMLGEGWFIGLIMDQDTNRHDGIIVKFFNEPTNYVPGAASMSRFKNVPIFPAFMHRNGDGTHTLVVQPAIYVEKTKNKREDIKKTTQLLASLIEEHIRKYPEEWFWLHDRWKSMREEFSPEEVEEFRKDLN